MINLMSSWMLIAWYKLYSFEISLSIPLVLLYGVNINSDKNTGVLSVPRLFLLYMPWFPYDHLDYLNRPVCPNNFWDT